MGSVDAFRAAFFLPDARGNRVRTFVTAEYGDPVPEQYLCQQDSFRQSLETADALNGRESAFMLGLVSFLLGPGRNVSLD